MSRNALLRSGKGLGIPGTARPNGSKIKLKVAPPPTLVGGGLGHFAVRNGVRCAGVHLIVDLHDAKRLDDIGHIEATLRRCVE
ncbi:MAG: adenosylmethionine decarboxylase, partial [Xanthobacteraceae bacterium]